MGVGRHRPDRLDSDGADPAEARPPSCPPRGGGELLDTQPRHLQRRDDDTRKTVWDKFAHGPEPVGYDPFVIPQWADGPTSEDFAAIRLSPYRLRVMPGTVLTRGEGDTLTWHHT